MTGRGTISVEFFFAQGCGKCAAAREALREAAQAIAGVQWQEVDVGREPNRAVDAGVLSTPALAIDGELVFASMPSARQLRKALEARAPKG